MRRCRVCSCTDRNACVDRATGETCAWAADDLCTFCAGFELAEDAENTVQLYSEADANEFIAARRAGVLL